MADLLDYALTTLADVKESMGIAPSDSSWDNIIIRKINQATRQIENYCSRRFKLTTYTNERYNAWDQNQITLKNYPIVGSVQLDARGTSLNSEDWETIDSEYYFANDSSGVLDLLFQSGGSWGAFQASYTAGYATIPEDLAEACATLAAYYALNADAANLGKQEIREGSRMVRYGSEAMTFKTLMEGLGIDQIIDSYASIPIASDI